jgi:O-antigen/teichoic acid export membrane protein
MSLWRTIVLALNLVGLRFGGAAIGLASQIVLARLLTQNEVGVVFLGMSAAAFISLLIAGGYPQLAITCLPRYYALGRASLVRTFNVAFLHDGLRISLFTFAIAAFVYFKAPLDESLKTALLFGCLSAPPSASLRINSAIANSIRSYGLSFYPDLFFRPGLFLIYLTVSWMLGIHLNVVEVLWVFVISNTFVAIGQAWLLGREGAHSGFKLPDRHNLASHLRGRAAALVIVGLVATAFADIVTLLAGFFLAPADVAIVGVAIRLAALAGFITQATQQFILPDLTAAMAKGTADQVRVLLLRINLVTLGAIVICVFGAVTLGSFALRIFGTNYEVGHLPLVLFMISQAFRAASGMNQHLLSIAGYQMKTAGSCIAAMLILFSATSVLAPNYGILGLACAVMMADAVWAVMLARQAKGLTGRRGDIFAVTSPSRT